jgi:hypothetical protein
VDNDRRMEWQRRLIIGENPRANASWPALLALTGLIGLCAWLADGDWYGLLWLLLVVPAGYAAYWFWTYD